MKLQLDFKENQDFLPFLQILTILRTAFSGLNIFDQLHQTYRSHGYILISKRGPCGAEYYFCFRIPFPIKEAYLEYLNTTVLSSYSAQLFTVPVTSLHHL